MLPKNPLRASAVTGLTMLIVLAAACQKPTAPTAAAPTAGGATKATGDAREADPGPGVSLDADDAAKLGIATAVITKASWVPEATGYAVVLNHEGIAQAVADLETARAASKQSRAALERASSLAGGAGALSAEVHENAERQAGLDAAARDLAERRLTSVIGELPTSSPGDAATLAALASGRSKLVRVTFPLDAALPARPASLRLARIGAAANESGWTSAAPWPAPADATAPGRSFFAVLVARDVSEGEHLQAYAAVGAAIQGLRIPAAAIVQNAGEYWCYLQRAAGRYARVAVDVSRPLADGYFVTTGVEPDAKVVTAAAALLLARELNPGTDAGG